MKTLLLLRHAKSSWKEPNLDDHERPLSKRGKRDAPRAGRWLQEQGLVPDLIISSAAKRARKTTRAVVGATGYAGKVEFSEALYMASPEDHLAVLRHVPDHYQTLMLVGHNPGLEELLRMVTGSSEPMSTTALAHISLPIEQWRELNAMTRGNLVHLWRPNE